MHPAIKYTFEKTNVIVENSESCQVLNFLDVSVILHSDHTIETDIYYKDTNSHDYLPYESANSDHSRDNVLYNLAKRIIVFVSNEEKIEYRFSELKNWLKSCKYHENVTNIAFCNARLQGTAPLKTNSNNIPFVTNHENVNNNEKVYKIRRMFNDIQSDHLKNAFKNSNKLLAQEQPKNLLHLLSNVRFNTDTNNFIKLMGLFKCTDKYCKICLLHVNEGNNFVMSNDMRRELHSHVTCRHINVVYYLKCNMCDHKETYIGKTFGDNVVGFKSRINQHISDCRTAKFHIHVNYCALKYKSLKEPYFQLKKNDKTKRQSAIRVL